MASEVERGDLIRPQWRAGRVPVLGTRHGEPAGGYVPAAVLLAGDESAMITGGNTTVDGGATAEYWPWRPRLS
ncbi:hypothetical protein ACQP1W_44615 [Spirillospora sp. CA-255316]